MSAIDTLKKAIKSEVEKAPVEDRPDLYDDLADWCYDQAVKAEAFDPDRLKRATDKGSQGLREPEV